MNTDDRSSDAALQGTGRLPDEPLGRAVVDLSPLLGLSFGGVGADRAAVHPPAWFSLSGIQVQFTFVFPFHFLRGAARVGARG